LQVSGLSVVLRDKQLPQEGRQVSRIEPLSGLATGPLRTGIHYSTITATVAAVIALTTALG